MKLKQIALVLTIGIPLFINMCGNPPKDSYYDKGTAPDEMYMRVNNKDSITFFWDAVYNYFDTIQYYEVFYHGTSDTNWQLLKSHIPVSNNPKTIIYRNEILSDDSILYFGVRCVTMEGIASDLHSCTESTASPPKWVLIWNKKTP